MSKVQWAWSDSYLVSWSAPKLASDVIPDLETQGAKNMRRPLALRMKGAKIEFGNVADAIEFLCPLMECGEPSTVHVGKCADGELQSSACYPDLMRALSCPKGHRVERRADGVRSCLLSSARVACGACAEIVDPASTRWRCALECQYVVCDDCYQHAAQCAASRGAQGLSSCESSTVAGSLRSSCSSALPASSDSGSDCGEADDRQEGDSPACEAEPKPCEGAQDATAEKADQVHDIVVPERSEQQNTEPETGVQESPKTEPKGKGKGKGPAGPASSGPQGDAKGKGKGKGKAAVEPTKPGVEPSCEMKSLPWTRYVTGSQLSQGETIWDRVSSCYTQEAHNSLVPTEELETRFGKAAGLQQVDKAEKEKVKKPKFARLASIPQDARFQMEVSVKTLPPHLSSPQQAVAAIQSLDSNLMPADVAHSLQRFLCPSEEQAQELANQRRQGEDQHAQALEAWNAAGREGEEPVPFQWDNLELYMEGLAVVPACGARLRCWSFLASLPERLDTINQNLEKFEQMVNCFHTSKELPTLLGLVLAFGNYLNGGKNQRRLGQADGFHIEALGRPGGLDVVNDPKGKNIRQMIFSSYFSKFPEKATQFFIEMAPLFALVQRRTGKCEGAPTLDKNVRILIEDLDKQVDVISKEVRAKHQELQEVLTCINDANDKFSMEMPDLFNQAQRRVDALTAKVDEVKGQFKAMLILFKAETYRGDAVLIDGKLEDGNPKEEMTSDIWCLLWDDFLIPGVMMLKQNEKVLKEVFEPRFCRDAPITMESLSMLWQLEEARPLGSKLRRRNTMPPSKSAAKA